MSKAVDDRRIEYAWLLEGHITWHDEYDNENGEKRYRHIITRMYQCDDTDRVPLMNIYAMNALTKQKDIVVIKDDMTVWETKEETAVTMSAWFANIFVSIVKADKTDISGYVE